ADNLWFGRGKPSGVTSVCALNDILSYLHRYVQRITKSCASWLPYILLFSARYRISRTSTSPSNSASASCVERVSVERNGAERKSFPPLIRLLCIFSGCLQDRCAERLKIHKLSFSTLTS